jgi:glutamate-1-semialdehyde 2,1-aminomutase
MTSAVPPAATRCILAGGVSSPVRAGTAVGGRPFAQSSGRGAYAYDDEGRAYVDYVMAYGPLLFGHAHPALVSGLDRVASRGTVFGSTHDEEERLAQRIAAHVPSVESLRFCSTGTEAVMSAVRVARAFTGRSLLLRFAGNYHGHFDAVLHGAGASAQTTTTSASGIPAGAVGDVAVARYNDLADVDRALAGRERTLAAILVEPIAGNMGLVLPVDGFLTGLFARAQEARALVIFDEVITWLRIGLGGAQGRFELRPDLTAFGKAMGGGFPFAAFGGRADVMHALAPAGAAFTGGTFSGNPFCVSIGHRMLDLAESDPGVYERLDRSGLRLAQGMRAALADAGLPYAVAQCGSMVDFKFRAGPAAADYDEAREADRPAFASYYHAMRQRRILLPPSPNELMFLSTEHDDAAIDRTVDAARSALAELQAAGVA